MAEHLLLGVLKNFHIIYGHSKMITFKQFLKQKKLYNYNNDRDEFADMYNKDLDVIDKDLEYDMQMKDGNVEKVYKVHKPDNLNPSELKDSEENNINDVSNASGTIAYTTNANTDIDEDGEGGGEVVSVAPSVSATGVSSVSSVSGDSSMGGTTSADIAGVPYGLTQKQKEKDIYSSDVIRRMDAYL